MTDITFVRTRYDYDSYIDFFRLVELAGFPTIYVDQLDLARPGVFIVAPVNGEWRPHLMNEGRRLKEERTPVGAHLVTWNIERPSGSAGSVGQYAQECRMLMDGRYREDGEIKQADVRFADEVWVSDRKLADETMTRFVVLGSHPDFGQPSDEKVWNVTHQSYANPRRQNVYKHFHNGEVGPNCWPPDRDEVIAKSRVGLCVHQDNHPFLEPLRLAIFAAHGLPILTETVMDAYPYGDETVVHAPFDVMVTRARQMLNDYPRFRGMGLRCRELMTVEFEFGKVVREAVEQSVGDWR